MTRIQRHFRSVTLRARFSPERLLTPPPSTPRREFALHDPCSDTTDARVPKCISPLLIKKPVGEVSKAYKLPDVSGLDDATYKKIEVPPFLFLFLIRTHCYMSPTTYQRYINGLIATHLETTATYTQQDRAALNTVLREVSNCIRCFCCPC